MGFFAKLRRKASGTGAPPTSLAATGDITTGLDIIKNISISTATIFEGCSVSGTGIPAATTVLKILNANTVLISNNATATTAALAITFSDLFKYGQIATDGTNLYYASQTNTPIRTVAGTGLINETINGLKTFLTRVKSGAITQDDTPPIDNNDLTRKDYVENLVANSTRQYIIEARRGTVYSDFLEAGVGLSAVAKCTIGNPLIVSSANGNSFPKDYVRRFTSDITFSGLQDNSENFLLLERNTGTDVFEPKSSVLTPIYDELRSDTDKEGKVYVALDSGTPGDTYYYNSYGTNVPMTDTRLINGAALDNTVVVSGATSLRINHTTGPGGYYPALKVMNAQKSIFAFNEDISHSEWSIGVFFQLDAPNAPNPTGVHTIFACSHFHLYVDPADQLLKANTALNQNGSQNIPMDNIVITAGTYLLPGNGNPLGLGITGPGGEILAGNKYHVAVTYDGQFIAIYLNGFNCGTFAYVDGAATEVTEQRTNYMADITSGGDLSLNLGAYLGEANNVAVGNFQHFVVDPYLRYKFNINPGHPAVLTQAFVPTIATCTSDNVRTDRNIRAYNVAAPNGLMFNFEGTNFQGQIKDYYNNTMFFRGGPNLAHISTAQSKFGTSSLRCEGDAIGAMVKAPNMAYFKSFTFEMWVRPQSGSILPYQQLVRTHPRGSGLDGIAMSWYPETTGTPRTLAVQVRDNNNNFIMIQLNSTELVTEDTWNHIALVFNGIDYKLFINGVLDTTTPPIYGEFHPDSRFTNRPKIFDWIFLAQANQQTNDLNVFTGWIDDFCILPVAKYSANFTPPTLPNVPLDYGATPLAGSTNVPGTYQYYYDIIAHKMFKGYANNYSQVNAIFIGEATTKNGRIEFTVPYSVGTKLRTDKYNDLVQQDKVMRFTHNFGTNKVKGILKAKYRRIDSISAGGEGPIGWTSRNAPAAPGITALWYFTLDDARNSSVHRTGGDISPGLINFHNPLGGGGLGSVATLGAANVGAIFVEFERLF